MSQQGMTIVSAGDEMGDLEFLQGFEDAGDLLKAQGSLSGSSGVLVSITPANGVTFYFVSGGGSIRSTATDSSVSVDLRNDGTVVDAKTLACLADVGINYKYDIIMDSLIGDGIKTYDINAGSVGANTLVEGLIEGYVV